MSGSNQQDQYYTLVPKLSEAWDESAQLGADYKRVMTGFSFIMVGEGGVVKSASVHRGFLTNGYSLPVIPRLLIKKWLGDDCMAVVLHDWLSEYLLIESNYRCEQISIYEALSMFIRALEMTTLTEVQIRTIQALCTTSMLWRSPYKPRLKPFKRYIEDKSYCTCN